MRRFRMIGEPGMYDSIYECIHCQEQFMVSADARDPRQDHMCLNTFTIEEALLIVVPAFLNKKDLAGKPYILHLLRVMMRFKEDRMQQIAVMHDLFEDCGDEWTPQDVLSCGADPYVVETVLLLTREKGMPYDDYINRIIDSGNIDAIDIKLADLEDNMSPDRVVEVTDKDKARQKKYRKAHKCLWDHRHLVGKVEGFKAKRFVL